MGLTKQYLRYIHQQTFGIIGSHQSNIQFLNYHNTFGRYVAVAACEDVIIWDLRSRKKVSVLKGEKFPVTALKVSLNHKQLSVGYVNGMINVFDLENQETLFKFNGHRSAVTVLNHNKDGFILVSGGNDTDVILWDLLQGTGMYRLKGHKGSITQAVFLSEDNVLITSSKDSLIKLWDLDTQHCFDTIIEHRSEVTDILVTENKELITGCADNELRFWGLQSNSDKQDDSEAPLKKARIEEVKTDQTDSTESQQEEEFIYQIKRVKIGSLMRQTKERLVAMKTNPSNRVLVCLNNDSSLEIYLMATNEELKKLEKRRLKKRKKKEETEPLIALKDIFKKISSFKITQKGHSFDCFLDKNILKIVCLSSNNTLSWYNIDINSSEQGIPEREVLETQGHHTEIRALSFSSDNTAILSASADSVKVWDRSYLQCIATMDCEYALCCLFLPGDRLCVVGTKSGTLQLFEIATASLLNTFDAHSGPVWSISLSPDKNGICSGGADKNIKFWTFEWLVLSSENEQPRKQLTLEHQRTLQMDEVVLAVKYSPDNRLVCVALMDNTAKLFYTDSLKFFVSLYGHSMPVLCLDVSSDSELIVTGSADRDVKLWGSDFGDCHKSLFAHDGSVTCVKFIPNTHMFFSCGKDKKIRQWDGDHFLPILTLQGHQDQIRCLAISPSSNFLVSASHDKSIRLWEKTEEIVIPDEEKEMEREEELDKEYEETELQIPGEVSKEVSHASRMSLETVKSIDKLMEAISLHQEESRKPEKERIADAATNPFLIAYGVDDTVKYVREIFKRINASELNGTLLGLPYHCAVILLKLLQKFVTSKWCTMKSINAILFLLRVHHNQLLVDKSILPFLLKLNEDIQEHVSELVDTSGYNLYALKMLQRQYNNGDISDNFEVTDVK
ncbi:WD repeat-containing protein 3 isoform X1 [Octopus sinensis]|uniref:WD repeat-containing protein 3 isoform X1 n=1 Tax=Octopus sinensis TaxID=2607531 RepID=A0A6P7TJX0_9MOLL|nr:WD repeat-containing protein 3 isoform X1 [Octopus sinensis]XP_029650025.1 WD repeat-containing protein 3 isoform X1 [Octopus sinensis]